MPSEYAKHNVHLKDVKLFQGLSPAVLASLKPLLQERSYQKGQILLMEANRCEQVFIVQSGRVKMFRTSAHGKEQILEVLEAGDSCVCNPGDPKWCCASTAQAMTDCKVWYFHRDQYTRLVRSNHELMIKLNHLFAERLNRFCSLIEGVSLDDPQRRLVKFILDMTASANGKPLDSQHFKLPYTHEEISQRIGVVRETVTRHLNNLKRLKLIDIQPHRIVVLDRAGLEKLLKS
ncbi:MAG: Crp/Fnr family transcriptional regulator [Candidatus Omnitrophota bacterium]|nr:Crp/Fnr family transcriptional regulator [Candidatus Omnitrophota bacterium]MDZ4242881.1 Crp/Fnr family transcriptional regulator [Candidatus Omnitrophota bacterium]